MQMKDRLEKNHEETDDDQHLDGRKRHQAMAADVLAHEIARTSQQLNKRIGQRAGVQPPKNGYVLPNGVPAHTSHLGTLTAARTEVVGKLSAAVMTMLHAVLVAIDIVLPRLLQTAETALELPCRKEYLHVFLNNNDSLSAAKIIK